MSSQRPEPEKIEAWLKGCLDADDRSALEKWLESHPGEIDMAELPAGTASSLKEASGDAVGDLVDRIKAASAEPPAAARDWRAALAPSDKAGVAGLLGEFEVIGLIAMGGMGTVLEGRDPKLDRRIAIKVLAPELAAVPVLRARFLREARMVAALEHDHILPIFSVCDDAELPFFVMRLAPGGSLEDALARGEHFGIERLKSIARQVASGLDAAHAAGIIHRDIKPANILFDEDGERLWVADFGVARVTEDPGVTYGTPLAGTPRYMSPEQAEGLELDGRSDLFSLGSVLFRCALGKPAFTGESTVATLKKIAHEEPEESLGNEFPKWFRNLMESLHAKDPSERPASAADVIKAIDDEYAPRPKRAERRRKFLLKSAAALTTVLIAAVILLQIPAVALAFNRAVAAISDRDIILSGRVGAFETLSRAVGQARPGETLVFTSDGPFPASSLEIPAGKPLTFEAAEGVLPRIEIGSEGEPGIIVRSDLTLRNLSFANPFPRPSDPAILRVVGPSELTVEQYYLSANYTTINRWAETGPIIFDILGAGRLRLLHSVLNTIDCRAILLRGDPATAGLARGSGASVVIEHSAIRCNQVFHFGRDCSGAIGIDFHRSLCLGRIFLWTMPGTGIPGSISVRASGSIFNHQRVLAWFGGEEEAAIRAVLDWEGDNNLYRSTREFLTNAPDMLRPEPSFVVRDLNGWRELVGKELPRSEEARFEKTFIDRLFPGQARDALAAYLGQFGEASDRGPEPARFGPN